MASSTPLRQRLADVAFPAPFALVLTESRLELRKLDEPKLGAVYVDFVEGRWPIAASSGGGRGQSIAKAVGLKSGPCRPWWMPPPGSGAMPSCSPPSAAR